MMLLVYCFFASAARAATSGPLLERMADSYIRRGVQGGFGYSEATLYEGIQAAYEFTQNETIAAWYRGQIDDAVVLSDGSIKDWNASYYSLDNYRIGNNILWWFERTGENKYQIASDVIRDQISRHTRNEAGGYWHRDPNYPDQMWLDGIFMADSFYARWTRSFDANSDAAWTDIALQYDLIETHCRNRSTNLLVHGYDESKTAVWANPSTGAAPLVWSRAVGWYYMSLLESIAVFPTSDEGHTRLVEYFTSLSEGLKTAFAASGGWWLIMSEPYPVMIGNYIESSAAAMFTFGILRGLRLGLLPEEEYLETATSAYASLVDQFVTENDDGTLNWEKTVEVGSLSSNASYEYYTSVPTVQNDHRGGGAFMLAAYEWELRQ